MKVLEICILDLFFSGHIEPFREWMDFDFSEPSSAEYIKLVKVSALLTQCCKTTKKKSVGFRHFSGGSLLQVEADGSLRALTLTLLNECLQLVPTCAV